ncbi:MAG TPA: GAF domain-containing protein [Polyangiaceae bacterium]|nr:GAF domain-containing protein [Polyangiaceae bacterium]
MALAVDAPIDARRACYAEVEARIHSLLDGEDDWIAALATVAAELHGAFDYFNWTGFYRLTTPTLLVIGPYQGGHGCLRIELPRGVCGAAATTRRTQLVTDVADFPAHIACSASTRSEIVVPLLTPDARLLGVLDVDSDTVGAFSSVDQECLERICSDLSARFSRVSNP